MSWAPWELSSLALDWIFVGKAVERNNTNSQSNTAFEVLRPDQGGGGGTHFARAPPSWDPADPGLTSVGNLVPGYGDLQLGPRKTIVGQAEKIRSFTWGMVLQWLLANICLVVEYLTKSTFT